MKFAQPTGAGFRCDALRVMHTAMKTSAMIVIMLAAGAASAIGCGEDEVGAARCVPGRVEACPCAGGGSGTQVCAADGTFGVCACGPGGDAADAVGDGADGIGGDTADASGGGDTSNADSADAAPPSDAPVIIGDAAGDASDHCDPCGYGAVRGRVCSPSLEVDVPNAVVELSAVDCDGVARTWTTRTGPNGIWELPEVPCGTHAVHVASGAFSRDYTVQVVAGQMNDHSGAAVKSCFGGRDVPIAVFWGQWDEQEDLLTGLGFDYTFFDYELEYFDETPPEDIEAVQVLRDPARLSAYRVLFFDCGSAALKWVRRFPEIGQNLRAFVMAGGSLYASDLSWAYIEAAFPDAIDFYGPDDLPSGPMASDGPQRVIGQQDYPATVDDPVLAAYLGTGSFTSRYGAGPLIAVSGAGAGTEVKVRGIVHVELPPAVCGDGLCDPSEVLQCADCQGLIPDEYVQHPGPMVLTHRPTATSGRVVYTTFHNDEQADELMKRLLNYLVFQL